MPRRRQRFRQLERDLKGTGYNPAKGTDAAEYFNFKKGINKIEVKNKATSAERERRRVALYPFNKPLSGTPTADESYQASLTLLTGNNLTTAGLTKANLGYEDVTDGLTDEGENYFPALLRVFNRSSMTFVTPKPKSGILKKDYNRYPGRNYSFPFGRSATLLTPVTQQNATEQHSLDVLKGLVKGTLALALMSYEPEEFGSPKPTLRNL